MAVAVATETSPIGTVLYAWGHDSYRIVAPPDVLTIGYGNRSVSVIKPTFQAIYHLKPVLVDIRLHPFSEREEWNGEALRSWLGNRYYCHLPALGNVNHAKYQRHQGIQLANEEAGMEYLEQLLAAGFTPVLLCACGALRGCHRDDVGTKLRARGRTVYELEWIQKYA